MKNFDIAIIGGGPAGYNAAANASANGLQVVLFEHTALGGVCLNEGCIPTKTLLHSANLLDEMRESAAYGIHVEGAISANYAEIIARRIRSSRPLPEVSPTSSRVLVSRSSPRLLASRAKRETVS